MKELIRRLVEQISGYRYREYKEYRDADLTSQISDEQLKYQRVQVLGAIILFISIPVSVYLYFIRDNVRMPQEISQEEIDRRVAARLLQQKFGDQPGNSIEDIKQWAYNMEREARREVEKDTAFARVGPYDYPIAPDGAPSSGATSVNERYNLYLFDDKPETGSASTSGAGQGAREPLEEEPERAAPSAPADERSRASSRIPAARDGGPPSTSADTGSRNPYRPKKYEPISLEPKAVDPY